MKSSRRDAMRAVVEAAVALWGRWRPVGWTEAMHSDNPTINCVSDRQEELALAVVEYMRREHQ